MPVGFSEGHLEFQEATAVLAFLVHHLGVSKKGGYPQLDGL